jgi:urease accessory protein
VHPSQGRPAIQRNHVIVEAGGELQLYLEPVIPFADSILRQISRMDVKRGGRLMFWEGFMAGRVGRGERWQFREFDSETHLFLNDKAVFLDRFRLPNGMENSPWTMGGCNYVGTGLHVGEEASNVAAALHERLPEAGIDSPAAGVAVMRVVPAAGPEFHRCREIFTNSVQSQPR